MSISKLAKKLQREVKTNPKKALALGLLVTVAVWFWAPLVLPSAEEPSQPTPAEPTPGAVPAPVQAAASPPTPDAEKKPQYRWQDLAKWIDGDPRMQPVTRDGGADAVRNPFVPLADPAAEEEKEPQPSEPAQIYPEPSELGLVLSSTVVGARYRAALINGKVYEEGRQVEAGEGIIFLLSKVEAHRVLLEREGRQFELEITRPDEPGRIEIRRVTP